ncbi:GRB2-associated-binding protein 3 isoform X4 [Oncorhynchus tshawytscha]|uniref:GRB2-associated-binding protein 3 isoform X4 n=1 Tax=Oncorhynchus tshawytscha TaxID=74940 RepID=UPI001C3E1EDE|nr:GRB2-associated-binding protein 3 isoform X4 [Oncorhynchus tshawytscha]XP_042182658.1 GRB2-associated-binding protein 3 isoform X4 [Oncorhynchus tshawytscha]
MSAGDVVCTGWLIKSPPEKKLKRYAWRRRWFVLRRGRMSGNPDVLEYYRNTTSKKPIRTIDLRECEVQMQTEQRLVKREFQNQHLFVIKTSSRIFYLVAKTEEEMNSWVSQIREICHFGPLSLDDGTESEEVFSHTPNPQQVSPALSRSMSFISNHDFVANGNSRVEMPSQMEPNYPLDYLFLSQCETGRFSLSRCDSFSNSERSLEQNSSDTTTEDVFSSPLGTDPSPSPFPHTGPFPSPFPHTGPSQSPYPHIRTHDPPFSAPCGPTSTSSSPRTLHRTPDVFQFDKPYSSAILEATSDGLTPPPLPPKPVHLSEHLRDDGSHGPLAGIRQQLTDQTALIPRRISLSGLPDHFRRGDIEGSALRSRNKRLSLNLPHFIATQSPNCHEDSYVSMASPRVCVGEDVSDGYIPMSPTPISFLKANGKTEAPLAPSPLPIADLPGDLEPPPINRDLKPRRRARPPPLDLRGLSTIRECPTHMPLIRTMTEPGNSLQGKLGIKGDQEASIPVESRQQFSTTNEGASQPWLRRSNLDYLSLDFNSASPSPVQKKPLLTDEHRVDYVQVDEKKTQALQNTKMEWKDVRQSKV